MRGIAPAPSYVIMQPTSLCNLDCTYCYLPFRAENRRMTVEVAHAVAASVNIWAEQAERFSVVWHGGEPTAAGRDALAELMAPFRGVEHHVQTNATLIDDAWCDFIVEHGIRVGVSVDGPEELNAARVDRGARPAYPRIVEGIAALRRRGIPFAALCVVTRPRPGLAGPLYAYFRELGCYALGINVEEREGVNLRDNHHPPDDVRTFWAELTGAWRADPALELRDVEWAIRYAAALRDGTADAVLPRRIDPIPTIAYDGSVVLLSPELAGFTAPAYGDFASGNVLATPLTELVARATEAPWIAEYLTGVEACRTSCSYFGFCGGGHAANRYFEQGRFDTTVTEHCRNSKILLMDGVLDHAGNA
ncbi:cyclophane-forming radical SAM peptide maturase AmcB [Allocatelliglobosispora scoriae]|nr:cyclophane-forming radical SAM peptide maturase AmcB [Allocatelliglobosispora scoriae]